MNGYLSAPVFGDGISGFITAPPSATSRGAGRACARCERLAGIASGAVAQRDSSIDQASRGAVSMSLRRKGTANRAGRPAERLRRRPEQTCPQRNFDRVIAPTPRPTVSAAEREDELLPCRVKATGGAVEPVETMRWIVASSRSRAPRAAAWVGELRPGFNTRPLPSSIATSATAVTSRARESPAEEPAVALSRDDPAPEEDARGLPGRRAPPTEECRTNARVIVLSIVPMSESRFAATADRPGAVCVERPG